MTKGVVIAAGLGMVVAAPLLLIVGFSGGTDTTTANMANASLDLKQVPAAYQQWIRKAAGTCPEVTGPLIAAQIDQESSWNPTVTSKAGAVGLSQFIPSTWATWGVDADGDGRADPKSPPDAIMTQARYDCAIAAHMKKLLKAGKVSGDLLSLTLAGYNAGPDAVESAGGIPPYPETQQYVKNILAKMASYSAPTGNSSEQSEFGARVVAAAMRYKGVPYSWGGGDTSGPTYGFAQGAGTNGFDCSGLVLYAVWQASGGRVALPHSSEEQATMGTQVDPNMMKVGDVIAFQLGAPGDYDHIGIYVGDGKFIHAPKTGDVVKISDLSDPYYTKRVQTVRRFG